MADHTGIEWTDASWNPIVGCSVVSPGCTNCYAMSMARRIEAMQPGSHYAGTTKAVNGNTVWTGTVALAPEHIVTQPLRWRRARKIFVNSMGDLFHESVPDEWIDRVFAIMAITPHHTYQALTKRSARMRAYINDPDTPRRIARSFLDAVIAGSLPKRAVNDDTWPVKSIGDIDLPDDVTMAQWPLPNVWLGVSTEDQRRADERVPDLLATPAAIRFISAEPLLGPLDLWNIRRYNPAGEPWIDALRGEVTRGDYLARSASEYSFNTRTHFPGELPRLDLVIAGGESGPRARPTHQGWARYLRDQCASSGVPFFWKQWGEWLPDSQIRDGQHPGPKFFRLDGGPLDQKPPMGPSTGSLWHWWEPDLKASIRVGKRAAGRLLDGVEHNGLPEVEHD